MATQGNAGARQRTEMDGSRLDLLEEFFDETLGRLFWLALAAVIIYVGLHSIGGANGLALAISAAVPLAMMLTGGRPLIRLLRGMV